MTSNYAQPSIPNQPYLGGAPVDKSAVDSPAALHWKTFALDKNDPDFTENGYLPSEVIGWELKIDDLRSGFLQVGDFARTPLGSYGANIYEGDYRTFASSTLDTRFRRYAILPPVVSQTTLTSSLGNGFSMSYCNIFGTLAIAQGNGANVSLFVETSGSNPVPSARTYTPGSVITALSDIVIGGATHAVRLCVMRSGAAPQILSDLASTPTVDATMHANLNPCYGMLKSSINAQTPGTGTNMFLANGGIWTLPVSAATGDAPTQVISNLPNGGYAIGVEQLLNGATRAWWWLPVSSGLASPPGPGYIMHTNLEGSDPVYLTPEMFGLVSINYACIWSRHLVVSDGVSVVAFDGQDFADLHLQEGRPPNSDFKLRMVAFGKSDRDLFCLLLSTDGLATNSSSTVTLNQYMPQFDAWVPVGQSWPLGGAAITTDNPTPYGLGVFYTVSALPSLPYSRQTGFMHAFMYTDSTNIVMDRIFIAPSGQNPFNLYRQTGASQNNAQVFQSPGTVTTPYFELPQMEGQWKRADQVVFLGDADAGGSDAKVEITLNGGSPIPFSAGLTDASRVAQTADTGDDALWMQLQIGITCTQGTSGCTAKTPNGLPVMVRGRTYLIPVAQDSALGGL